MTPTFIFIMWMCVSDHTTCPIWEANGHSVIILPESDRAACDAEWNTANHNPDPPGLFTLHRCQPIGEDL